jgi:2-hydroxy-3-oxopropionate reductase
MSQQPIAAATGVIGLGVMGHPMAANILRSGQALHITGRSPKKYGDLVEAGAVWHDTAQSLADAVGVIVLMLPDLPQVEVMLAGPDGILAGGFDDLLLIIASTSSPIEVRDLGRRLTEENRGQG